MLAFCSGVALGAPLASSEGRGDKRLDGHATFPWYNLATNLLPSHDVYHSTDAIHGIVDALVDKCGGALSYHELSGKKGTDHTRVMRLTAAEGDSSHRTKVMYTAGIHGREYIASEVGLKFLEKMCDGSEKSKDLLKKTDLIVFPVVNVAGRKRMGEGMFGDGQPSCASCRKNENNVDLNRNFDIDWNSGSDSTEAEDYRGSAPQSEPQSVLLEKVADGFVPKLYVDLHSGDTTMMYPYSYKQADAENSHDQQTLALKTAQRVWGDGCKAGKNQEQGNIMCPTIGNAAVSLEPPYLASGTTLDFMYMKKKVPYAYTWEVYKQGQGVAKKGAASRAATQLLDRSMDAVVPSPHRKDAPAHALQPGHAATSLLAADMDSEDCFAFFNPTSKVELDKLTNEWADALMAAADVHHDMMMKGSKSMSDHVQ